MADKYLKKEELEKKKREAEAEKLRKKKEEEEWMHRQRSGNDGYVSSPSFWY